MRRSIAYNGEVIRFTSYRIVDNSVICAPFIWSFIFSWKYTYYKCFPGMAWTDLFNIHPFLRSKVNFHVKNIITDNSHQFDKMTDSSVSITEKLSLCMHSWRSARLNFCCYVSLRKYLQIWVNESTFSLTFMLSR